MEGLPRQVLLSITMCSLRSTGDVPASSSGLREMIEGHGGLGEVTGCGRLRSRAPGDLRIVVSDCRPAQLKDLSAHHQSLSAAAHFDSEGNRTRGFDTVTKAW